MLMTAYRHMTNIECFPIYRSNMAAKYPPAILDNWQSEKTLQESLAFCLNHKLHADVVFQVGTERKTVEAHKLLLTLRSHVFETMFTGGLAAQHEVVLPDVEVDIFSEFLK